jgi:hypothetical protein
MTIQAERQEKLQELDQPLQRFQHEHPVQAWAAMFGVAAVFTALVWLLVDFIEKGKP